MIKAVNFGIKIFLFRLLHM